jgi:urease accessory protein
MTKGPLYMQKLFYPEGINAQGLLPAHGYLLHPPGGLVSGDKLETNILLEENAQLLLTTPAAQKVYRARDLVHKQIQNVRIFLKSGASLEYLPQENIIFSGARAKLSLSVFLRQDSRLIAWDILSLGRPEADEFFDKGTLSQSLKIIKDGRLIFLERLNVSESMESLRSSLGYNSFPCYGLFMAVGREDDDALKLARDELREHLSIGKEKECFAGITLKNGVLLGRALGYDMELVRSILTNIWKILRPRLLNREATIPRIWNT